MRTIRIPLTISEPCLLESSPGMYRFIVLAETLSGEPLNHPDIPNSTEVIVPNESNPGDGPSFTLYVETDLELSDSVSEFRIRVYRDSITDICVKQKNVIISVDCDKENLKEVLFRAESNTGGVTPFDGHVSASEAACSFSGYGDSSYVETSLTIGAKIWTDNSSSSCDTLPDGYYYFRDPDATPTLVMSTFRIQSGVITEATPFTCDSNPLLNKSVIWLVTEDEDQV